MSDDMAYLAHEIEQAIVALRKVSDSHMWAIALRQDDNIASAVLDAEFPLEDMRRQLEKAHGLIHEDYKADLKTL